MYPITATTEATTDIEEITIALESEFTIQESTDQMNNLSENKSEEIGVLEDSIDGMRNIDHIVHSSTCEVSRTDLKYPVLLVHKASTELTTAFEFYCNLDHFELTGNSTCGVNCTQISELILSIKDSGYQPSISNPEWNNCNDDMQDINKGLIGYHHSLTNISKWQEFEVCRGHRAIDIDCNKDIICTTDVTDPEHTAYCRFEELVSRATHTLEMTQRQHAKAMEKYGLTPVHDESLDIGPISCSGAVCGNELKFYTLTGLHNAIKQSKVTLKTYMQLMK